MRIAQRTLRTARLHPALRCICGRVLHGHDFDIEGNCIRLRCGRCHAELIEIVVSTSEDQKEQW
jgi:hypothetical protein